jgi:laccase
MHEYIYIFLAKIDGMEFVRHGVRQVLSAWADGPAYVTQCPLQTGKSFVQRFQIVEQRGTLFWHAHISWLRATLYGAIVIKPRHASRYPFSKPAHEYTLLLGICTP